MATIEALMAEGHNRKLRRHGGLKQIVYLAPQSVEVPTSLFSSGNELIDPVRIGFHPVGLLTDDGVEFNDSFEVEGSSSVGYTSNTREDPGETERGISVTLQESYNKFVEGVVRGADYSGLEMSENGEVVFDDPSLPILTEYRGLVLSVDGPPEDQWIMGKLYFALQLSSRDAYSWAKGVTMDRPVSFTALDDAVEGIPSREIIAGTGPLRHAKALGFDIAAGGGDESGE
ncbi:hypothetical protein [Auritidibacter ignavus]|uniref:hypothetical protein n=1 Tax=Auritidibacter ignavus TaxID=678932 RepID=UPI000F021282|nr:hypothetical protein [Auritidibacter ignavus]NIH72216.1 hypothetical protein [Auritidibacter ignavus]RMX23767.1 hypothetical protein DYI20_02825 [Auritidibacter ignavus]WGH87091.1 hypothetical protein QDX24_04650 [Auritidibacter ignavus]WGH89375.1 hypothetical protein QDX22_04645 [Auritidibacter ignavus]WGH91720.1 hypothetical protein QDX23_05000 [Auritidibacter ignavus]